MEFPFVLFGATGICGRIAARDLLECGFPVLLCGRDRSRVASLLARFPRARFQYGDLEDEKQAAETIRASGARIVLNAAEDNWNPFITKLAVTAGRHVLDLGSDPADTAIQFALHDTCRRAGVTAITGCGSTPGITNVMLRYVEPEFDTIETVHAGFSWVSNQETFVVPFSIQTLVWEFRQPAYVLENGQLRRRPPQEPAYVLRLRGVGPQLLRYTWHVEVSTFRKFLRKKGVRNIAFFSSCPEHSRRVLESLTTAGFDSYDPVRYSGTDVKPAAFLAEVTKRLAVPPGYAERENLWLIVEGTARGKHQRVKMECVTETIPGWEDATCNVDTGMPLSIIGQMILDGRIAERGSFAPEFVVPPEPFFAELARRGIPVYRNGRLVNGARAPVGERAVSARPRTESTFPSPVPERVRDRVAAPVR